MNLNVYLPDDLGAEAKEADLQFSQLLRSAVIDELERRRVVSETLAESTEHLIEVVHPGGYTYTGRVSGSLIYGGHDRAGKMDIYLTGDKRLLRHNGDGTIDEIEFQELAEDDPEAYVEVALKLGEKPIIDL